MNEVTLILI